MGEWIYTTFKCGGRIDRKHVKELCELGTANHLSVDQGGEPLKETDIGAEWSGEVNYGNLDELTAYCHEHDIDYEYYFSEGPGWDACQQKYIDGVHVEFNVGEEGPWVSVAELTKLDALATGWAEFHEKIRKWNRPFPPVQLYGEAVEEPEEMADAEV